MSTESRSLTLFELGENAMQIEQMLLTAAPDATDDELEAALQEALAALETDTGKKLDGYGALIRKFDGLATLAGTELERLQGLRTYYENHAKRLKRAVMNFMKMKKKTVVEGELTRFTITNNGGKIPMEIDQALYDDATQLPERFQKVFVQPDTDAIREALEAGEEIDGCKLLERGTHLRIK